MPSRNDAQTHSAPPMYQMLSAATTNPPNKWACLGSSVQAFQSTLSITQRWRYTFPSLSTEILSFLYGFIPAGRSVSGHISRHQCVLNRDLLTRAVYIFLYTVAPQLRESLPDQQLPVIRLHTMSGPTSVPSLLFLAASSRYIHPDTICYSV